MLSKKYTVLVDMDDVMIDTLYAWVDALNFQYGTSVDPSDIVDWDMAPFFKELSANQVYSPLYDPAFWATVKPKQGAQEYVSRLIDDGYKVVVVTATDPAMAGYKFCSAIYPYFKEITSKDIVIAYDKSIVNGDAIVDDCFRNLVSFGSGCKKIMFDAPHNKKHDETMFGMYRAHNWQEVYNYIINNFS